MILVAGGTGRLGRLVVARLVAAGIDVRVLTRDPDRAAGLSVGAIEIAQGDVRDPSSIVRAMGGVTTVFSAVQGFAGPGHVTPGSVDRAGNMHLVDAAAAAEAHVVLMSVVGATVDSPMELFRAKYDAEEHLRSSGTPWTIVRASAFVELWAEIMKKPIVFGRGENPINFVSVYDVAAVAERAIVDQGLRGRVIEVGGPENLTFNQLAALLQDVRGSDGKVRHIPRAVLRVLALGARQPRAALVMDSVDMTFDAASARAAYADLPASGLRAALTRACSARAAG
jgi:NADH dehydrogenase